MSKQFLTQVTVTGADDSVDPHDLIDIQKKYPFAEFGILLYRDSMGNKRFPSKEWLMRLYEVKDQLNLSGHVCGKWTKEFLMGDLARDFTEIVTLRLVKRWQFNTHGYKHPYNFPVVQNQIANAVTYNKQKVILQYDEKNSALLDEFRARHTSYLVQVLFDLSGGNGILPENWQKPLDVFECGYAGGLSPDNVKSQLDILEGVVGDRTIWIDFETYARSDDDTKFDLNKVALFLENSKDRVIVDSIA